MKEQLQHALLLSALSFAAINPLHAFANTTNESNAQTLQQLAESKVAIQSVNASNADMEKMSKNQLSQYRRTWRTQLKAQKGNVYDQVMSGKTAHWLESQSKQHHFAGMILSNAQGYGVAQTIPTKTIRPRFVSNALKKNLRTAKVTPSVKNAAFKQRVTRIMVPVRESNHTIGMLTAMIDRKNSK